ncbi:MAG: hypothetical protein HN413_09945 [Chloroflexi bacterium]|jgi:hypothetical protein|nr:hypothetical protein [Chloroflexota bacterium]
MSDPQFWQLVLDALTTLGNHYIPAMDEVASKMGVDRGTWVLLLSIMSFDPEPVTAKMLQKRTPCQEFSKRLEETSAQGLLATVHPNEYVLTETGQELVQQIILTAYARMENLNPMRPSDLHYLTVLLRRLVKASHTSPEPPAKWAITHSRRFDPGENAPLLIQVDQCLSDLAAYHDDAHLAAWGSLGFEGPAWEAYTLIWREKSISLDNLHKKLHHRRQSRKVYENALREIVERGLAKSKSGEYYLTPEGLELRQQAEDKTNEYFLPPWNCLEEEDLQALGNLLKMLADGLK